MRAGGKMVVNITSIIENGRQYQVLKNRSGIYTFVMSAYSGNRCGRKSKGDEKLLIDLKWP